MREIKWYLTHDKVRRRIVPSQGYDYVVHDFYALNAVCKTHKQGTLAEHSKVNGVKNGWRTTLVGLLDYLYKKKWLGASGCEWKDQGSNVVWTRSSNNEVDARATKWRSGESRSWFDELATVSVGATRQWYIETARLRRLGRLDSLFIRNIIHV